MTGIIIMEETKKPRRKNTLSKPYKKKKSKKKLRKREKSKQKKKPKPVKPVEEKPRVTVERGLWKMCFETGRMVKVN